MMALSSTAIHSSERGDGGDLQDGDDGPKPSHFNAQINAKDLRSLIYDTSKTSDAVPGVNKVVDLVDRELGVTNAGEDVMKLPNVTTQLVDDVCGMKKCRVSIAGASAANDDDIPPSSTVIPDVSTLPSCALSVEEMSMPELVTNLVLCFPEEYRENIVQNTLFSNILKRCTDNNYSLDRQAWW